MMIEETERNVAPVIAGSVFAKAQGGKGEIPTLAEARDKVDNWLMAEPDMIQSADQIKRIALGLTRR
jgi:hypothetical protein